MTEGSARARAPFFIGSQALPQLAGPGRDRGERACRRTPATLNGGLRPVVLDRQPRSRRTASMQTPWQEIPLEDYEGYMALPSIGQGKMLADQLGAAFPIFNALAVS
jgi:hypothetical protein